VHVSVLWRFFARHRQRAAGFCAPGGQEAKTHIDHRMKAVLNKVVNLLAGSPFRRARHRADIHNAVDGMIKTPTSAACAILYLPYSSLDDMLG
jgi:hypothetical protein